MLINLSQSLPVNQSKKKNWGVCTLLPHSTQYFDKQATTQHRKTRDNLVHSLVLLVQPTPASGICNSEHHESRTDHEEMRRVLNTCERVMLKMQPSLSPLKPTNAPHLPGPQLQRLRPLEDDQLRLRKERSRNGQYNPWD